MQSGISCLPLIYFCSGREAQMYHTHDNLPRAVKSDTLVFPRGGEGGGKA